jgi:hypothetical protein
VDPASSLGEQLFRKFPFCAKDLHLLIFLTGKEFKNNSTKEKSSLDNKHWFSKIITRYLGWLGVSITGLALIMYGYLGTFSRFYADDFCMSGYVTRLGFWQAQWFQYTSWSNRFSGMFLLSVLDLFGKSMIKYWTSLTILFWVIGLTWALFTIINLLSLDIPKWTTILVAEWTVLFSILLAPQIYQSLFWRIGLITYTIPLVLLSFLIGILVQGYLKLRKNSKAWYWMVGAGLLAFLGGGLSETYLALQISLLVLVYLLLVINNNKELLRLGSKPVGSALLGAFIALVIVLAAPGNAVRQAALPAHPAILEFAKIVVSNSFLFIYISMKNNAFQMLLAFIAPMMFVYFAGIRTALRIKPSSLVLLAFLSPILLFVLTAAVMAPAAFAESSYPDGRVLMDAGFLLVVFLVTEGILFGLILSQLHNFAGEPVPAKLKILSALIILMMILYPLYDSYRSFRTIPEFRTFSTAWDARDSRIKSAVTLGLDQIVETSLAAPGHLVDLGTDPKYWVNTCMAYFYGTDKITATP